MFAPMSKKTKLPFPVINTKRKLLLIFCFYTSQYGFAQKSLSRNSSIGIQSYFGSFLVTKPKAAYMRDSYASFVEIYFQKQTTGSQGWEVSHNYPQWGIGFISGNTGSRQYAGNMYALFGYINTPLVKSKNYTGSLRIGGGPGIIEKPYNIYTNPKNTLIGSKLNAFINLALQNEIKINSRISFNAGLAFTHLSNGGSKLPNLGLNTPCLTAGLRYAFDNPDITVRPKEKNYLSKQVYKISLSTGIKQIEWVGGPYNIIAVLQPEIQKRFSANNAYGGGLVLFINPEAGGNKKQIISNSPETPVLQSGIFGLYEHFFGRISIPLQFGIYVHNKRNNSLLYQQFGLRVNINKRLNSELHLKTHLGKADLIHAGIGYTF
jgi:hypothetical protein